MKIIVAGYSKTGTKSLNAALTELGYNVYDYLENLQFLYEDWYKILEKGTGSVEDFKRMYKDVDVSMDTPVYLFWEEIHQAFPDAKIILTTREVDSWYKSWVSQMEESNNSWFLHFSMLLTPSGWRHFAHCKRAEHFAFGDERKAPFCRYNMNEMVSKHLFRQHYTYILQKAPKEKLLVYNIKEGWKPLCKFLGKDIPEKPFPHLNIGGSVIELLMKSHPYALRMKKELFISGSLLVALAILGGYKLHKAIWIGSSSKCLNSVMKWLQCIQTYPFQ